MSSIALMRKGIHQSGCHPTMAIPTLKEVLLPTEAASKPTTLKFNQSISPVWEREHLFQYSRRRTDCPMINDHVQAKRIARWTSCAAFAECGRVLIVLALHYVTPEGKQGWSLTLIALFVQGVRATFAYQHLLTEQSREQFRRAASRTKSE
jgi:hypothetical protein